MRDYSGRKEVLMTTPSLSGLFDFKGKVVVVTGSSRGLGRGIAKRFSEASAHVVVHYHQARELAEEVVSEITHNNGSAIALKADVSNVQEVKTLVKSILVKLGRIDVWINNAGIYPLKDFISMTEEDWDDTLDVNLKSVFLCSQAAANAMILNQIKGSIINIASIEGSFPAPIHSHYNASKAGVLMYTKAIARELAPHGIRVNAVSPGLIGRPGLEEDWPEGVNAWKRTVPMNRLGQPEDIADACLFLASDAARWITGVNLIVDGGASTTPSF
jgi:NAD(P)-dependent dehydrogenase (short-subunit alcohol dehydrogenase family)